MTGTLPTVGVTTGGGATAGAAMAGAAAIPGLNALLIPLLMSFGPSIISKLFNKGQDPSKEIERLLRPENLAKLTDYFYKQAVASPAFGQAQGTIAAGANQTANQVAAGLAERGVGTTGTGAILSGLTPSLVGSQTAKLRTSAYEVGQNAAMQNVKDRIAALTNKQPSQSQQLLGVGVESISPYLQSWLKVKYPSVYGNLTVPGGGTGVN